jgi:hypothetical protein
MFSIQEITAKFSDNLKAVRNHMDATASFHPDDVNLYSGLGPADQFSLRETLKAVSLSQLLEYLGKGTTLGDYLVAAKVHDDLIEYTIADDLAPACGFMVNGWQGGDLKVPIREVERERYSEHVSGAIFPSNTASSKVATLTPTTFGYAPRITNDLLEDAAFDLVSKELQFTSEYLARHSNQILCTTLKTATDGWGTVGSSLTGDADVTKYTAGSTSDIVVASKTVGDSKFEPNTIITTYEAWFNSIVITGAATVLNGVESTMPLKLPFKMRVGISDVAFSNTSALHLETDADGTFTDCITLVFDKRNAVLTGRKRWMKLENYADPVKDLAGMTVTCRQGCVTLYNNAIYRLTET